MAIRRRKIQAMTTALLEENSIYRCASPCGANRKDQRRQNFLKPLEGGLSGFLYRDSNKSVIGVNTSHPPALQNFTIAHELGHLMLHDQEGQLHVDHECRCA